MFVREEGPPSGEALLCLHGFPTASWDWHVLWPHLVARDRVIAADMIGYGFSDKPRPYAYAIADQADLVEALLADRGVRRVHLLAHDVGDTVAQELLARHAERKGAGLSIASACLLNGGLFPETHRPTLRQRLIAGPLGGILGRFMTESAFGRSFSVLFGAGTKPSADEMREFWSLVAFNDGPRVAHDLLGYIRERRAHRDRWVGALRTGVPLLVINGSDDPVSGAHMVARLREEVTGVEAVELPGIGHYPQVEAPGAVLDAWLAFRARLAG